MTALPTREVLLVCSFTPGVLCAWLSWVITSLDQYRLCGWVSSLLRPHRSHSLSPLSHPQCPKEGAEGSEWKSGLRENLSLYRCCCCEDPSSASFHRRLWIFLLDLSLGVRLPEHVWLDTEKTAQWFLSTMIPSHIPVTHLHAPLL